MRRVCTTLSWPPRPAFRVERTVSPGCRPIGLRESWGREDLSSTCSGLLVAGTRATRDGMSTLGGAIMPARTVHWVSCGAASPTMASAAKSRSNSGLMDYPAHGRNRRAV